MANQSILQAFERMWQHCVARFGNTANENTLGLVKTHGSIETSANIEDTSSGGNHYGVKLDSDGKMFVEIPGLGSSSGTLDASLSDGDRPSLDITGYNYVKIISYSSDINANDFGLKISWGNSSWSYDYSAIGGFNINNAFTIEIINQRILKISSESQGIIYLTRVDYPSNTITLEVYTTDDQYTSSEKVSFEYYMSR